MKTNKMLLFCFLCLTGVVAIPVNGDDTKKRIEKPVKQAIDIRQVTQEKKESWLLEQERLTALLEQLQEEQEQLKSQKSAIDEQVQGARTRLARKKKQLTDIEEISQRIRPFLEGLISEMETQQANGLPFLVVERKQRMERLKSIMVDPDISISEKYRKVMEALQVEAEYGFTIEVYQETIDVKGKTMLTDIFRLGRLSLFFLSLDRKHGGFYNTAANAWQTLPSAHLGQIQAAVDIASKRRTAELLTLPLGRITPQ